MQITRKSLWILGVVVFFWIGLASRVDAATLFLDPASQTLTVGAEIEINIKVDTQGVAINATEATLNYPRDFFEGVSVSKSGSILTVWAEEPTILSAQGQVTFAGGRPAPGFIGAAGQLLRVKFRALKSGQASLTISGGRVLANDGQGTNVFSAARAASYTLTTPPPPPEEPPPPPAPAPEAPPTEAPPIIGQAPALEAPAASPSAGQPSIVQQPFLESAPTPPIFGVPAEVPAEVVQLPSGAPIAVVTPACGDGLDNDRDGLLDFPADPGCADRQDLSETDPLTQAVQLLASFETAQKVSQAVTTVQKTKTYKVLDKKVVNNPVVEETTVKVAVPVVTVAAAANVGAAVNLGSIWVYFQSLFTQPFLLFARRRRKQWGVVYSSLTKLPVDLAVVRLFQSVTGKLLQTRVTDKQGRYVIFADQGTCRLDVVKPGFEFPSKFLVGKTTDFDYVDVYLGGTFEVAIKGTALTRPIPLDPLEKSETPKAVRAKARRRAIQKTIAWSGPTLAMAAVVITPTLTTGVLLAVQLLLIGLFRRLAEAPRATRSWGLVTDVETGQTLRAVVVRIFEGQFNKLLETQVTDSSGRYAFLAGRGQFYIAAEKSGYAPYRSEIIDLQQAGARKLVKQDIRLRRVPEPQQ